MQTTNMPVLNPFPYLNPGRMICEFDEHAEGTIDPHALDSYEKLLGVIWGPNMGPVLPGTIHPRIKFLFLSINYKFHADHSMIPQGTLVIVHVNNADLACRDRSICVWSDNCESNTIYGLRSTGLPRLSTYRRDTFVQEFVLSSAAPTVTSSPAITSPTITSSVAREVGIIWERATRAPSVVHPGSNACTPLPSCALIPPESESSSSDIAHTLAGQLASQIITSITSAVDQGLFHLGFESRIELTFPPNISAPITVYEILCAAFPTAKLFMVPHNNNGCTHLLIINFVPTLDTQSIRPRMLSHSLPLGLSVADYERAIFRSWRTEQSAQRAGRSSLVDEVYRVCREKTANNSLYLGFTYDFTVSKGLPGHTIDALNTAYPQATITYNPTASTLAFTLEASV